MSVAAARELAAGAVRWREFGGADAIAGAMAQVASGALDAALVRAVMARRQCRAITAGFMRSPQRVRRHDGVPGYIVGPTHYGKAPREYFAECAQHRGDVEALFAGTEDPMRSVHQRMREQLGVGVRPSTFEGGDAVHARAVEWLPDPLRASEFLLQPHEDGAQVDCDRNAGWEMRRLERVIALNFYAEVEPGEGQLRVYDLAPDRALRCACGLETTGYPYPPEVYAPRAFVDLPVAAGDLAIIHGNMLHAVTRTAARRIVINSFIGQLDTGEFAYWT